MRENDFRKNTTRKAEKAVAEEETQSEKKKFSFPKFSFLRDRRFHVSLGFLLMAFSFFLFICLVSYIFTGKADQSVVESIWDEDIRDSGLETDNWLGLAGALLSHYFIFKGVGIAAFLFVPIFFLVGYKIVFRKTPTPFMPVVGFSTFFMVWLSSLFGYLAYVTEGENPISFLGGSIGYHIALYFQSLAGYGTFLILGLGLLIFIVYFFNITEFGKKEGTIGKTDKVKKEKIPVLTDDDELEEELEEVDSEQVAMISDEYDPLQNWVIKGNQEKKKEKTSPAGLELQIEDIEDALPPTFVHPVIFPSIEEPVKVVVEDRFVVPESDIVTTDEIENYDPTLDLSHYIYPTLDLLNEVHASRVQVTKEELEANKDKIVETLGNYGISIASIKATIGPTITLYEIVPDAGIRISKIKSLEDDIALSLAALGIRIIAPMPGKGTIGIEVPNKNKEMVQVKSVFNSDKFLKSDMELPILFGKTISNELFMVDLAKMPHLLMAGATGTGKSVGLNMLLASLLYKKHPSQLKMVLVDPKKVELSLFSKVEKHFLAKLPGTEEAIITDTKKVVNTLNSLCIEMDSRYDLLKDAGCRNLKEYNGKFVERRLLPTKGHKYLPYIVVVIDELADLMMTAGKEVETPIARIAQLARAVGIHMVLATQRPSVNVITGIIKANFPARASFKVSQKIDSRTILDEGGADQLIGMGDMLIKVNSDITRLQCAFIDTPEVERLCDFIGNQRGYPTAYQLPEYYGDDEEKVPGEFDINDIDPLLADAARLLVIHQMGSTSLIQRKMSLGYNRAGRIMDQLEALNVVGPNQGSKAREVLVLDEMSLSQMLQEKGIV
ncbi:MAG: DNA translocase FtsK 4TM domain-containing protein [Opitutaceae bacterium]|nr:DNA translocase FtsK 4TM domain-containing protein [Cytophagales bacterium]